MSQDDKPPGASDELTVVPKSPKSPKISIINTAPAPAPISTPRMRPISMIRSLSPVSPTRDLMSSLKATSSHLGIPRSGSISSRRRLTASSSLETSVLADAKNSGSTDDADDCAKPISSMARSIVTMLTAASMYAGMELDSHIDADEDEEMGDEEKLDEGIENEGIENEGIENEGIENERIEEEGNEEHDETLQPITQPQVDQHPDQHPNQQDLIEPFSSQKLSQKFPAKPGSTSDSTIADQISQNIPQLSRRSSLFEISVIEKLAPPANDNSAAQKRAVAISDKLKNVFDISDDEEFIADYSCWLLRDVLLQGHLYLTTRNLLFFAYLPRRQGNVAMSGSLGLKTSHSRRVVRRWAVLRDNSLSLYASSTDMYFPSLTIDLQYALKADIVQHKENLLKRTLLGFKHLKVVSYVKLLTESRNYTFELDSEDSAQAWVAIIKKHIFAARYKGNRVSLKVPLPNILDLELTPVFEKTQTLKIKIMESAESFAVDDYHLMFFYGADKAVENIQDAIKELESQSSPDSPDSASEITDTVEIIEPEKSKPSPQRSHWSHRLLLSPRHHSSSISKLAKTLSPRFGRDSSSNSSESVVEKIVRYDEDENDDVPEIVLSSDGQVGQQQRGRADSAEKMDAPREFGGPAKVALDKELKQLDDIYYDNTASRWSSKSLVRGVVNMTSSGITHVGNLSTMWSAAPNHYDEENSLERGAEDPYLIKDPVERAEATQRFQKHFSLPQDCKLISSYYAHLIKNVPVYGKIYIGDGHICYRSLIPGTNTWMILPFGDIENVYKEKGFRFGYSGLVIVIHGHEELFFEFGSSDARDDCELLLLRQMDSQQRRLKLDTEDVEKSEYKLAASPNLTDARVRLFENRLKTVSGVTVPIILEDNPQIQTDFKPKKAHKFVLLTIGSRGDVQPYIALGKGLVAEGHKVKIVTHEEFQPWIEKHGLAFAPIAGDPAELMNLMVTHGTMSVAFLKEASSKFRGWISELLASSWEACKDADVLIESPSAMAGIHIAELLGIPYFRAFTMPWTKTRAYPHAFIVPDQKRGGSYNYLTHVMFENVFWKGISGQVNKWRVETLHLPKTNLDHMQQGKVPFLYNISPTVFPPSVDFPSWVKVTGYWFLNEGNIYEPPEEMVLFMKKAREDDKKLVYIGFGSIVVSDPRELTKLVVDAVVEADVRCILNKGWSDRLGALDAKQVEVELPDCIYNTASVPHDWLFPQIDAAVHHGGSGTTGASLRAGLPTIIKPFFGDQFFYANRIVDIGAGVALRKLNSSSLCKLLKEATSNQRILQRAQSIGEKIREEDGVKFAISAIYSELEYAKKLILNKRQMYGPALDKQNAEMEEAAKKEDDSWLMV